MTDAASTLQLANACRKHGASIHNLVTQNGLAIPGDVLLWTISGLETSYGRDRLYARFEQGYAQGGRYYVPALWKRWGALTACSYGSFQVMYVTANGLGFNGHPCELQSDDTCAQYAALLILRRIIGKQGAKTLSEVLDGYNSGSCRDGNVPAVYVRNGCLLLTQGPPIPPPVG